MNEQGKRIRWRRGQYSEWYGFPGQSARPVFVIATRLVSSDPMWILKTTLPVGVLSETEVSIKKDNNADVLKEAAENWLVAFVAALGFEVL